MNCAMDTPAVAEEYTDKPAPSVGLCSVVLCLPPSRKHQDSTFNSVTAVYKDLGD